MGCSPLGAKRPVELKCELGSLVDTRERSLFYNKLLNLVLRSLSVASLGADLSEGSVFSIMVISLATLAHVVMSWQLARALCCGPWLPEPCDLG